MSFRGGSARVLCAVEIGMLWVWNASLRWFGNLPLKIKLYISFGWMCLFTLVLGGGVPGWNAPGRSPVQPADGCGERKWEFCDWHCRERHR